MEPPHRLGFVERIGFVKWSDGIILGFFALIGALIYFGPQKVYAIPRSEAKSVKTILTEGVYSIPGVFTTPVLEVQTVKDIIFIPQTRRFMAWLKFEKVLKVATV